MKRAEDVRELFHEISTVDIASAKALENFLLFPNDAHVLLGVLAFYTRFEGTVLDEAASSVPVEQFLELSEHDGFLESIALLCLYL